MPPTPTARPRPSSPVTVLVLCVLAFNMAAVALLVGLAAETASTWSRRDWALAEEVTSPESGEAYHASRRLARELGRQALTLAGNLAAPLVRHAERSAWARSRPIPTHIRDSLGPYFPQAILDQARYAVRDAASPTLDSAVFLLNPGAAAVTFGHVVVFRRSSEAQSDWKTWAHELVHVMQYDAVGLDCFVLTYAVTLGRAMETPAYRQADRLELILERRLKTASPS